MSSIFILKSIDEDSVRIAPLSHTEINVNLPFINSSTVGIAKRNLGSPGAIKVDPSYFTHAFQPPYVTITNTLKDSYLTITKGDVVADLLVLPLMSINDNNHDKEKKDADIINK